MEAVFAGAGAGVAVTMVAENLIANLKRAVGCEVECSKLQKKIEKIRPYLELVEIQLTVKKNEAQKNCEIMAKWLEDMKAQMEAANLEVHKCLSGHKIFAKLSVVENTKIAKRIEKVNNEISFLLNEAATMTGFAFNLANTPQAANTQSPVVDTAQQQNANALHHGYSSTPNILQTPDFQSPHALHHVHSLLAVRTSHNPPMAHQSMSKHSSPVSAYRTQSSRALSNQSQAAASWTPSGTPHLHHRESEDPIRSTMSPDQCNAPATSHLHHSRPEPEVVRSAWSPDQWPAAANRDHHRRQSIDHPGFLRGAGSAQETLRQRELDIHRIKDAEEKTRSDQRRQSIANPQQRMPTSYQPSAPPHYQAPSAQPRHNDPSAAPSAPSAPYSLLYSHCTE